MDDERLAIVVRREGVHVLHEAPTIGTACDTLLTDGGIIPLICDPGSPLERDCCFWWQRAWDRSALAGRSFFSFAPLPSCWWLGLGV